MSFDRDLHNLSNLPNIRWHQSNVTRQQREEQNKHRGGIIWFTGLSGSGKSTIAHMTEELLHQAGCRTFVLDGDNVRHGLCRDLGFTEDDRHENIRRIGEVSKLFMEAGILVLTAFISPFLKDREKIRQMVGTGDFIEIYCFSSLEVCELRDTKGLYKKARAGEISEFTGISSLYEAPENPDLILDTEHQSKSECVIRLLQKLRSNGIFGLENILGQYSEAELSSKLKEYD